MYSISLVLEIMFNDSLVHTAFSNPNVESRRCHSLVRKETQQEIKYAMPVKVNILKVKGLGSQDTLF